MHVHLPKQLHGWREFLKEYAIIVLGVLTALALDQLVEAGHDRRLAREAREAINQELQTDLDRVTYRARQQSCIVKRLDDIQALLAGWRGDSAFPPGLRVGFPGDVGLVDQRWQANLASARFSEQPPDQQADQASIYTLIHVIDKVENREIESWSQLRTVELGSQALSTASKPMIAQALASARNDAETLKGLSGALLASLRTAGAGRPGMMPSTNYVVAYPGTTCQPLQKGSAS
jgi:hypothetical protein